MAQAQKGNTVSVHYTGKLEDGTVFDTSRESDPLSFTLGDGQVIPGFETAIEGLEPGQSTTTEITPDEAYGQHREDMVLELERERMPQGLDPQVGQQLQLRQQNGQALPVVVTSVSEETVTIDANHPLAGKKLIFDIELVDVNAS